MSRQRKTDGEISNNTKLQRNWTPEQREANKLYQREYREKNKQVYAKAQLKYALRILAEVQNESHEELKKTYLSDLLEKYPHIERDDMGHPDNLCPSFFGLPDIECGNNSERYTNCAACWNQELEEAKC